MSPATLFDTELAGRLLGHPRVGLAALTELSIASLKLKRNVIHARYAELIESMYADAG